MGRIILTMVVGLVLGAGLGALCCWLIFPIPQDSDWVSYPTLTQTAAQKNQPVVFQHTRETGGFRFWLYLGVLLGGGFGAVVGAIVGFAVKKNAART